MPTFRKRTWSHLSLASTLNLTTKEMKKIAKGSFQNLMITCLEYAKFAKEKNIGRIAQCKNPEYAASLLSQGKGVIFFCGHQANWEVLFLEGTQRMPGTAIGRPIKNTLLYNWVLSIRTKYGGKIVPPKKALYEGLRALKKGSFLGIVGDQAMPDSGYQSLFMGRKAWTSSAPALLAHRTGACIIVAMTKRTPTGYSITYSDPIYPDPQAPLDQDVDRMMLAALDILEKSICDTPEEWLWQHNRWKQQLPGRIKSPFRHDALCVLLSKDTSLYPSLKTLRNIYPTECFHIFVPKEHQEHLPSIEDAIIHPYAHTPLTTKDYRFKLVFNWTQKNYKRYFPSAFQILSIPKIYKLAKTPQCTLEEALQHALLDQK